jgi:aspartate racemase
MKHIGIVACSAEGASLCYRTIIEQAMNQLSGFQHPEITMHTLPLSDYMVHLNLESPDWQTAGEVMLQSIATLKMAGADFAICPDNTIHEAYNLVREDACLPYVHIIDVTVDEAIRRGMKKILVLGTTFTMNGSFYPDAINAKGLEYEMPDDNAKQEVNRIIWEELLSNHPETESIQYYVDLIEKHRHNGCDGVILGCTEIPLMINDDNSPIPTLDSTRLLAAAALDYAVN